MAAVLVLALLAAAVFFALRSGSDEPPERTNGAPTASAEASDPTTPSGPATPSEASTPSKASTAPDERTPRASSSPSTDPSGDPEPDGSATPDGTSKPATSPGAERPTTKPFAIDEPGRTGTGRTVRVLRTRSVQGEARLPGEIGGPSVAVDIEITSGERLDLANTVVSLYYGPERTPAVPLTAGTRPVKGTIASGRSATGTYVFRVPPGERTRVVVTCDLTVSDPVVVFRGSVR